jgi:ribose transport system ATP-binding protein
MRRALASLGHGDIDLDAPVRSLSIGTQQVVEIARALICDARLVIMDEPTSSLSAHDAEALFGVIDRLASSGMAVIYISHFLEEIRAVAHRYTVLRDGSTVATGLLRDVTLDALVETMVGRELAEMFPRIAHEPGESVLTVTGLRATTGPRGVDLELRRGEILGIAGLVGSGRSETIRSLFGLHAVRSGTLTLRGSPVDLVSWTPAQALASGLDLLSENRKEEGLATRLATRINVCLSSLGRLARYGFVDHRRERAEAVCWRDRLAIKCPDVDAPVEALSGGNQQKVALARNLLHDSDILFLDEPTRGIDIGSKAEICRTIGELAASGKAVVMVSSYLPELLGVCDRIGVMHRGRLSPVRPVAEWTEESIMHFATTGRMRRAEGAHNARPGRESGSPNVRALAE